ncbi:Uma2 family endonuclease [Planobispora longispora]|uniref:Uma2 family endonuclease n=1 Tax=Planobispora longispora TaxID=28887 RepID=UPI001EF679B2|nr:Uma2 family endonuclease [Planobispora longispora]
MTSTMSETTDTRRDADSLLANWPYPPPGGWTADDLDLLPPDGPNGEPDFFKRVELLDGALIFMSPQRRIHERLIRGLTNYLDAQAPEHLAAVSQMDIKINKVQRPSPDILVIDTEVADDDRTSYDPAEVHLVVEVVSPESKFRDRKIKPLRYASAGIKHFWRIGTENGGPIVYVYELDPASQTYVPSGIHHGELSLEVPFSIKLDLNDLLTRSSATG